MYDAGIQNLHIGKFVAGGLRLRFLLNGQHEMRTISTEMFSVYGNGFTKRSTAAICRRCHSQ